MGNFFEQFNEEPKTNFFEQFHAPETEPVKPAGTLGAYGQTIKQAVKGIPAYVNAAIEGDQPYTSLDNADKQIAENAAAQQKFIEGPNADAPVLGGLAKERDIRQGANSMSGTLTSMAPALAGAAYGSLLGPVGAAVGGIAGGALGLYGMKRYDENQFIRQNIDKANAEREAQAQPPLSQQEAIGLQNKLVATGDPQTHGLWEAGSEMLGTAAELGIALSPLKGVAGLLKPIASPLARAALVGVGKATGILGTEIGEELVTNVGQNPIQKKYGFPENTTADTIKQTGIQMLPLAGLGGIGGAHQGYTYKPPEGPLTRAASTLNTQTGATNEPNGQLPATGNVAVPGAIPAQQTPGQDDKATNNAFLQPGELRRQALTARASAAGITDPKILDTLVPKETLDAVTGFYPASDKVPTVKRAREHVNNTGESAYYVEADIANLGGLNSHFKNNSEQANPVYRAISDIFAEEMANAGHTAVNIRHGGDEFGSVVIGGTKESIVQATNNTHARIEALMEAQGLHTLPHAKSKPEAPKPNGVHLYMGHSEILPGKSLEATFKQSSSELDSAKIGASNVGRKETGTTGDEALNRQPGGEASFASANSGASGTGGREVAPGFTKTLGEQTGDINVTQNPNGAGTVSSGAERRAARDAGTLADIGGLETVTGEQPAEIKSNDSGTAPPNLGKASLGRQTPSVKPAPPLLENNNAQEITNEKQNANAREETAKALLASDFDHLSAEGLPLKQIEGNLFTDHLGDEVQDDYAEPAKPKQIQEAIDALSATKKIKADNQPSKEAIGPQNAPIASKEGVKQPILQENLAENELPAPENLLAGKQSPLTKLANEPTQNPTEHAAPQPATPGTGANSTSVAKINTPAAEAGAKALVDKINPTTGLTSYPTKSDALKAQIAAKQNLTHTIQPAPEGQQGFVLAPKPQQPIAGENNAISQQKTGTLDESGSAQPQVRQEIGNTPGSGQGIYGGGSETTGLRGEGIAQEKVNKVGSTWKGWNDNTKQPVVKKIEKIEGGHAFISSDGGKTLDRSPLAELNDTRLKDEANFREKKVLTTKAEREGFEPIRGPVEKAIDEAQSNLPEGYRIQDDKHSLSLWKGDEKITHGISRQNPGELLRQAKLKREVPAATPQDRTKEELDLRQRIAKIVIPGMFDENVPNNSPIVSKIINVLKSEPKELEQALIKTIKDSGYSNIHAKDSARELVKLVKPQAQPKAPTHAELLKAAQDSGKLEIIHVTNTPKAEAQEQPAYGANNKLFTKDAADAARERLKAKLGRLNSGFDPEMMLNGLTLGGYHVEAGARTYAAYAKAMINDLGNGIIPYLQHFYNSVRDYPGFDSKGMASYKELGLSKKYGIYQGESWAFMEGPAREVESINENFITFTTQEKYKSKQWSMANFLQQKADWKLVDQETVFTSKDKLTAVKKSQESGNGLQSGTETTTGNVTGKTPAQSGVSAGQSGTVKPAGDQGRKDSLPAGPGQPVTVDTGQGQRDALSGDAGLAGHETDGSDQSTIEASTGGNERLSGNPGAANYDLRDKSPVALTPAKRRDLNNLALGILKKPVADLTAADKEVLRHYTGSGGLDVKASADKGAGIFNQHYTAYDTIQAMYGALMDANIPMLNNLEPSAGSGNFIGLHPHANWTAVDIDKTNTEIVKRLYPDAQISNESYETFRGQNYDLIISNVPFASFSALAREYAGTIKPAFRAIHNFFFAQSVDKLKTNGVMAFMTSTGTMDGTGEAARLRAHLVKYLDVIGAFRLPMGTQKANASTDVMIDVIFLQKRPTGVASKQPERNQSFVDITSKDSYKINQYFVDYPESVLGELSIGKNKTSMGKVGWIVTGEADYSRMKLEPQDYTSTEKQKDKANDFSNHETAQAYADKHGYKFVDETTQPFFKDGIIYDTPVTYNEEAGGGLFGRKATGQYADKLAALQEIDKTHDAKLVTQYEEKYSRSPHTDKLLQVYAKNHYAEQQLKSYLALFDKDFNLSEIFTKQVRFKDSGKIEVDEYSPLLERAESLEDADGLLPTTNNLVSADEAQELLDSGDYARVSDTKLQNARLYYAGNIYDKLDALSKVKPAAQRDLQAKKLEQAKPKLIPVEQISITGKESWLPDSAIASIGKDTYTDGTVLIGGNAIRDNHLLNLFNLYLNNEPLAKKGKEELPEEYAEHLKAVQTILNTEVLPLIKQKLLDDGLADEVVAAYNRKKNFFAPPVFDGSSLKNLPPTFKDKPFKLMQHQQEGAERAIYNKKGVLAFSPGLGKTPAALIVADQLLQRGVMKKPLFIVPANTIPQWEASARSLYPDAKIFEFPKYQNGINKDKAKDWPSMTAADKQKMVYDLTNNRYDFTFISTNLAQKFAIPERKLSQYLDELTESISDMEQDDEELTKSQLKAKEQRLAKIRMLKTTMMKAYAEDSKEGFNMGKLGFDAIFADEVQYYKNIGMQSEDAKGGIGANVAINATYPSDAQGKPDKTFDPLSVTLGSSRSYDFRFKTRYISENNNGNNIFLLTGTPTPNKPLELMTLLHHLDTHILDEYGIANVGDFVSEFLDVQAVEEIGIDGTAKMRPQLVGIKNIPALKKIISRYVDYRSPESAHDLTRPTQIDLVHTVLRNDDAELIFADIQARILQSIQDTKARKSGEKGVVVEPMIAMYGAGRDGSIDVRLYSPTAKSSVVTADSVFAEESRADYSKIAKTVELVAEQNQRDPEAGQLIFLDRLKFAGERGSTHEDIRNKVIAATGLSPQQVIFVNGGAFVNPDTGKVVKGGPKPDALQKIMDAYNAGKIKVLIGNTSKLGVGVDLQVTTTDVYQIDKPYRPDEIEQRNNRAVRQGNRNAEVRVHTFNQPGTFDAMSDRIIANKQGFNDVFWKDQASDRADVKAEEAPSAYDAAIELEQNPAKKRKLEIERDLANASSKSYQLEKQISNLAKRIRIANENKLTYSNANAAIDTRETPKYEEQTDSQRKKSVADFKKRMAEQKERNSIRIADITTDLVELTANKAAREHELSEHKAYIANIRDKYVVNGIVVVGNIKQGATILHTEGNTTPLPKSQWLSSNTISQVINRFSHQFSHETPILISDSARDILNRDIAAKGMVYQGRIYLFRDSLNNTADVAATLWHELLHYGLRRFLTRDQYIAAMDDLYSSDNYIRSMADAWIDSKEGKTLAASESADYVRARGVDEALAEMAEDGKRGDFVNTGMIARSIRSVVRWLARLANKMGFKAISAELNVITNDDARKLISSIFRKLENNDVATSLDWAFKSDPSFSIRTDYTPEAQAVKDTMKSDRTVAKLTPRQKIDRAKNLYATKLNQKIFDRYRSFKDILHSDESWMMSRLSANTGGVVEMAIEQGHPVLDASGAVDIDMSKKSLKQAAEPLQGEIDDAMLWMAALRAEKEDAKADAAQAKQLVLKDEIKSIGKEIREMIYNAKTGSSTITSAGAKRVSELRKLMLMKQQDRKAQLKRAGIRERYITPDRIAALKTLTDGTMTNGANRAEVYEQFRKDYEELNTAFVQIAVQTGTIDAKEAERWSNEGFYVPFYRFLADETSNGPKTLDSLANNTAYQHYKGSAKPLEDILINVIGNWHHLIDSGLKNQAATHAVKTAVDMGLMEKVESKIVGRTLDGKPISKTADSDIFIRENGKKVEYRLTDANQDEGKLVLESLLSMNYSGLKNVFMAGAIKASGLLRFGVVANPAFKARNLIRDTLQALAAVNVGYNPASNVYKGWNYTKPGQETITRMIASAGAFGDSGYLFMADSDKMLKAIKRNLNDPTVLNTKDKILKLWDAYQDFGARLENVNRAVAFEKTLKETGGNLLKAANEANDLLAFQAHGSSKALYELTRVVPFLNAGLQGIDKIIRSAGNENTAKRFWTVTSMYMSASVLLALGMAGDDDYDQSEDWERESYHLFKIPGSDTLYKLPRPFEIGAMASIAERIAQQIVADSPDPQFAAERIMAVLASQMRLNPIPQISRPVLEIWANKSMFTGRDIESQGLLHQRKSERAYASTSLVAQGLAKGLSLFGDETPVLSRSPVEIEHLVNAYTGWLGAFALSGTDAVLRPLLGETEPSRLSNTPFLGKAAEDLKRAFMADDSPRNTKFTTTFYDNLKTLESISADMRHARELGNSERISELKGEYGAKINYVKAYRRASTRIGLLNKLVEKVWANDNMSGEQKRERIDALNKQRNVIAKTTILTRVLD